jgi:hypothetical protein
VESLAFQEQDAVVAACATSALWSAFNGTGKQFQHHIPSPVEITKSATAHVPLDTRTFPNSIGLSLPQMADAIRSVGLEPYTIGATDQYVIKGNLYAYLRGHIPVLLGIKFPRGLHAVTVAGYSLGTQTPVVYPQSGFLLKAFRMDKIYAHDDQIGPFARMEFLPDNEFGTSRLDDTGLTCLRAAPTAMLVPLYPKIRIPFNTILAIVFSFASVIEEMQQHGIPLSITVEWDIYLTDVNSLKSELRDTSVLLGDYRRRILTRPMPRFLWRATALLSDKPALDLLFDATDIEQGQSFVGVVEYNKALGTIMRAISQTLVQSGQAFARPDQHVLSWLAVSQF